MSTSDRSEIASAANAGLPVWMTAATTLGTITIAALLALTGYPAVALAVAGVGGGAAIASVRVTVVIRR